MEFITNKVVNNEIVEVWQGVNGTIYFIKK